MRYLAIAMVLIAYPLFVVLLKANPQRRHWAYFALGLLPFTLIAWNLDAGLINWATWSGYVKGAVMTVLDSLALAIITTHGKPRGLPPLSGYFIAYIGAVMVSAAISDVPMAALFYVFQLLRIFILMIAVAKIVHDPRALNWLAMGLAAGIGYQAGFAIWQKFHGAFQAGGTMHQNQLGLMTHFVILPLLAMLLGGIRSRMMMFGVASSLVVIALGASRATMGFGLLGISLLVMLSLWRRTTAKKWQIVGFAALSLALVSPFMLQGINNRLGQLAEQGGGYDERAAFERAAKAMFADQPMGVGANQYVLIANIKGYSRNAGVIWNAGSRSANVHNVYLLMAAETGWLGLLTLIVLFALIIITGLRFAFQYRDDPAGDVVLGCVMAVFTVALHNFYEWIWVTYSVQYVFAISMGIIAGLVRSRRLARRKRRRAVHAGYEDLVGAT